MNTTERRRRNRQRPCQAVAMHRARIARRQGRSRLVVLLIFLWAILSGSFPPRSPGRVEREGWPVTDYERGMGVDSLLRPRRSADSGKGRYRSRPTLSRLMADLRRPSARNDAALVLLARVTDHVTRAWAAEQIANGEINRLSIYVRPGRLEETSLAAWRDEADAALTEDASGAGPATPDRGSLLEVARLLEALAGTETVTNTGPRLPNS